MADMRYLLIMLFIVLMPIGVTTAQSDLVDIANQANEAYERGEYDLAIDLYESLISFGVNDAVIYLNLGNAYYQRDQLGWALINCLRAHQLSPRDDEINTRIAQIRSERVDFLIEDTDILNLTALATDGFMTIAELRTFVWVLWCIWFIALSSWLLLKQRRVLLRVAIGVIGLPLFLGLILLLGRGYVESNRPVGVIVETTTQVMSGPSDDYIELYQLYSAVELRIIEQRGEWVRFRLTDGREGWLPITVIARM